LLSLALAALRIANARLESAGSYGFLHPAGQLGGLAGVAARGHGQQAVLVGLRDLQAADERVQRLGRA
jgi:hypothetical protein